jgi:hypothetical protein
MDSGTPPSIGAAVRELARALAAAGLGSCKVTFTFEDASSPQEQVVITAKPQPNTSSHARVEDLSEDELPEHGISGVLAVFPVGSAAE